jgi:hypothetical protein
VAVDADRRAHVAVVLEVAPEHIPDALEARLDIALDFDHDTDLTTPHRETRCQLPTTGVMVTCWLRCVSNRRTEPSVWIRGTGIVEAAQLRRTWG